MARGWSAVAFLNISGCDAPLVPSFAHHGDDYSFS